MSNRMSSFAKKKEKKKKNRKYDSKRYKIRKDICWILKFNRAGSIDGWISWLSSFRNYMEHYINSTIQKIGFILASTLFYSLLFQPNLWHVS